MGVMIIILGVIVLASVIFATWWFTVANKKPSAASAIKYSSSIGTMPKMKDYRMDTWSNNNSNSKSSCSSCNSANAYSGPPKHVYNTLRQEEPLPIVTEGEEITQRRLVDMSFSNPIPDMLSSKYSSKRSLGNFILGDLKVKPRTSGGWIPYDTDPDQFHRGILGSR